MTNMIARAKKTMNSPSELQRYYKDRNSRTKKTAGMSDLKQVNCFGIHKHSSGYFERHTINCEPEEVEKLQKRWRGIVGTYAQCVGLYVNVKFEYIYYDKSLSIYITHDGIRYK